MRCSSRSGRSGFPCVYYELGPERKEEYADFSSRHLKKKCAIIVDDIVCSAPSFRGRIYGAGIIMGSFTEQEVTDLALGMRSGTFPVRPVLVSQQR